MKITENMSKWFADLLDPAISDARGGAMNERIWAKGADNPVSASMHLDNAEELMQYAEFLKEVKKHYGIN